MKSVRCIDCANYKDDWCEEVKDSTYELVFRECEHFKRKTNRDALEQLSTHELAGILCDNVFLSCKNCPGENMCFSGEHANGLEKWLNMETVAGDICWEE